MSLSLRDVNKSRYSFPEGYDSIGKSKRALHPSANAKPLFGDDQLPRSIDAIFAPLEENEDHRNEEEEDDDDENNDTTNDGRGTSDTRVNNLHRQIGEFAPIKDSYRLSGKGIDKSSGTSIRLDSLSIVRFSIREDAVTMNTPHSNCSFLPSVMTSFSSALDTLCDLVHDHILVPKNDRYGYIELDDDSGSLSTNLFVTPLKHKIAYLVEVLMHLNHVELTLAVFKQWGTGGIQSNQNDRFNTCLHDILAMISNFVNENQYEISIFQNYLASREFTEKFKFVQHASEPIIEIKPLLLLTNIPQLTLQSFRFDIQLTSNHDTNSQEELRYHLNYMLVYQLLIQKLAGVFVTCLSLEKKVESGLVLRSLEGFLSNCIELDSAELLVGLDTAIDDWAQRDNERGIVLSCWCSEMARKHNKLAMQAEAEGDLDNEGKYNVVKLFIQQLKDVTNGTSLGSGFTILTAGLDTVAAAAAANPDGLIRLQNQGGKTVNIKRWIFGQQSTSSHKQRLLKKCNRIKWKLLKWSQKGFSRSKKNSAKQQQEQHREQQPSQSKGNNSELVSLSISHGYRNWQATCEHTPSYKKSQPQPMKLEDLQDRIKKFDEFKRKRDKFIFLFFGEDT